MARDAVFRSWWNPKAAYYRKMEKIPDEIGTAASVQAMVFGNHGRYFGHGRRLHARSGHGRESLLRRISDQRAGRGCGRGNPHAAADFRAGESSCRQPTSSCARSPASLEQHYRDMQDFEFTIEDNKLYMLQTRNGKRTGPGGGARRGGYGRRKA